jgi:glycosyltransferase involved in cell wall biosynthesis
VAAPELSAIVLCYRAGEDILHVLAPLQAELEASEVTYELVLVANYDEGADDPTPAVVDRFAREHERVVTVAESKAGAMGWDMRSGLAASTGRFLIVIDGDEQNPVEDVLKMYRQMKDTGADVMKGRRIARFDGYYRHLISVLYNMIFLLMFRTHGLWDINGKPKGLTREAYERMRLRSDDWFIDAEIVLTARELGMRVEELPVVFRQHAARASFVHGDAIGEFIRNMLRRRLGR